MKKYILILLAFALVATNADAQLKAKWGGTGKKTLTANGVLVGNGTSAIKTTTAAGADSGKFLMSNGASATPTWQTTGGGGGGKSYLSAKNIGAQAQNLTRYYGLNAGAIADTVDPTHSDNGSLYYRADLMTSNASVKNMHVVAASAPPGGQALTVTIMKNGSPTGLSVTMSNTDYASDTVHSFTVEPTDLICAKVVTSASSGSMTFSIALELEFD